MTTAHKRKTISVQLRPTKDDDLIFLIQAFPAGQRNSLLKVALRQALGCDTPTGEAESRESDLSDMDEYIRLSQAALEFRVKKSTLGVWVWDGKIEAREEVSDLGQSYHLVKRGDVAKFLEERSDRGRPLKRIDK